MNKEEVQEEEEKEAAKQQQQQHKQRHMCYGLATLDRCVCAHAL